jgi:hypothetical protein
LQREAKDHRRNVDSVVGPLEIFELLVYAEALRRGLTRAAEGLVFIDLSPTLPHSFLEGRGRRIAFPA